MDSKTILIIPGDLSALEGFELKIEERPFFRQEGSSSAHIERLRPCARDSQSKVSIFKPWKAWSQKAYPSEKRLTV